MKRVAAALVALAAGAAGVGALPAGVTVAWAQESPPASEAKAAPADAAAAPAAPEGNAAGEKAEPAEGGQPSEEAEAPPPPPSDASCLSCHEDPELEITLKSGETRKLQVDKGALSRSVHAGKINCIACHADLEATEEGHPKKRFKTAREFTTRYSERCAQCHSRQQGQNKAGVHEARRQAGNPDAATCADCHGGHQVRRPTREAVSQTCARCHAPEAKAFESSVHGRALIENHSADVPSCTDCHAAHDAADAKSASWRLSVPEKCGSCHADEKKMAKYGLSTQVLKTYLDDFHGSTAALQRTRPGEKAPIAVCSDCHGVHDIRKTDAPDSPVLASSLVGTCRKCHSDATDKFPAAWLSHREPSWTSSPLVFGVRRFYTFFVSFVIGGLVLQIGMHLYRRLLRRAE